MENPEEHGTKRDQFDHFLIYLWLQRNIARGLPGAKSQYTTTETFKIGQDDAWLELSFSQRKLERLGNTNIQQGQTYFLHLHRRHNGAPKYPDGVLYTGGLSEEDLVTVIRKLSSKVSDEDVNTWFNWRFREFDGSFRKLKPLIF